MRFVAPIVAVVIGIVFIVMGCISLKQVKNFPTIEAVVTDVTRESTMDADGTYSTTTTVYVTYTIDGQEYEEILQNAGNDYTKGDEITVLYNPEDPTYVSGATKGSSTIGIIAGCVITVLGLGLTAKAFIGR